MALAELYDNVRCGLPQLEATEHKVELATNSQHKFPQLETTGSGVELPAGYGSRREIGELISGILWI